MSDHDTAQQERSSDGSGDAESPRPPEARSTFNSRWSAAGMPAEETSDFGATTRRLWSAAGLTR